MQFPVHHLLQEVVWFQEEINQILENGVKSKYKKLLAKYFNEGRRNLSTTKLSILKHSLLSDRTK